MRLQEIIEVVKLLNESLKDGYAIFGGCAVALFSFIYTGKYHDFSDIDILTDKDGQKKLERILKKGNIPYEKYRNTIFFDSIWLQFVRYDEADKWKEFYNRRIKIRVFSTDINIIRLEDLAKMKTLSNREKDHYDRKLLEKIIRYKKEAEVWNKFSII